MEYLQKIKDKLLYLINLPKYVLTDDLILSNSINRYCVWFNILIYSSIILATKRKKNLFNTYTKEILAIAGMSLAVNTLYEKLFLKKYLIKRDDEFNKNSLAPENRRGLLGQITLRLGRTNVLPAFNNILNLRLEIVGNTLKELPTLPNDIMSLDLSLEGYTGSHFSIQKYPRDIRFISISIKETDIVISNLKDTNIQDLNIMKIPFEFIKTPVSDSNEQIIVLNHDTILKNFVKVQINDFPPSFEQLFIRGINNLTMPELPSILKSFTWSYTSNKVIPKLPDSLLSFSLHGNMYCNYINIESLPKSIRNLDLQLTNISMIDDLDTLKELRVLDICHTPIAARLQKNYNFNTKDMTPEDLWSRHFVWLPDVDTLKRIYPEYTTIEELINKVKELVKKCKKEDAVKRNKVFKLEFIEWFWNPERGDRMWWFWEEDTRLLFG